MIGRKARLELMMNVAYEKVRLLNGGEKPKLIVPANIGGKLTKIRHYVKNFKSVVSFKSTPIARLKPSVLIDTDSEITGGPKNSIVNSLTETITEYEEEEESSDYVSTLRDPNESSY